MTLDCKCNRLKEAEAKAAKWDALVRCGECALFYTDEYGHGCCENNYAGLWDGELDDYCSFGVRR